MAVFRLIDTAGIHETDDVVECIGIEKTKQAIRDADFILCILDASSPLEEEDKILLEACRQNGGKNGKITSKKMMRISSVTGDGIDELEKEITSLFLSGEMDYNKEIYITNMRQKQEIWNAKESLCRLRESIDSDMPEDFYTIDMTDAYESLGRIIGETIEDDIVDKIFRDFCMGK